jgi:hypothetical protein
MTFRGDTTGIMNFLAGADDFPVIYLRQKDKSNAKLVPQDVKISDCRLWVVEPTLEKEGFALFPHEFDIRGETDPAAISRAFFPILNELIKRITGAPKIINTPVLFRSSGAIGQGRPIAIPPARFVHSDFNVEAFYWFAHKLVEKDPDRARWLGGRILAFNIWRVISRPPQDIPLAVLDRSSVDPKDQVKGVSFMDDPVYNSSHGTTLWRYNETQRWCYFSDMTPNETLVFASYDSDDDVIPGPAHCGFDDPRCPSGAVPRSSLETRVFCYWGR